MESKIVVGGLSEVQLGRGFVCQQAASERKIAWTGSSAEFFLNLATTSQVTLTLLLLGDLRNWYT
jgi:hypothetical protein